MDGELVFVLEVGLEPRARSGKNTYISRISTSVIHLRGYTNAAISNILPETPHPVSKSPLQALICRYWSITASVRVFHDVLLVVHNVLCVFHIVLQVFHDVL